MQPTRDGDGYPTPEEVRKRVADLRKNPRFLELLEQFAEQLAHSVVARDALPLASVTNVDLGLAEKSRDIAVRLLILDVLRMAPAADVELARVMVATFWRETPLVVKESDGEHGSRAFLHGEPWQRALAHVFETPGLIPIAAPFEAVRFVLRTVVGHGGVACPTVLSDVEAVMQTATNCAALPKPIREQVSRAIALMEQLRGNDTNGKPTTRITYGKAGGRTPRLSPWGAAVKFAAAFGLLMPEGAYDATR